MGKIDISIIMGIYNCEEYLQESIESIINQTFENWELIMCDDGSSDNTYLISKKYRDKYLEKIILLKNEKNIGLNETLNKCLKVANGKYIARQDGDDISEKNRLKKEIDFLNNNPQYAIVSSNMLYFDENGIWGKSNSKEYPTNYDFLFGSPFCHAPSMIRKSVIDEVNGYSVGKKLLRVEDYHLWFKIYEKGYIGHNIQETLYRMRDDYNAYKRRTIRNRLNEVYVRCIGYKMLKIPFYMRIFCLRPILVWLIPNSLYTVLHKMKLKKGQGNNNGSLYN